jgi:hypothetical protein
MVGGMLEKDDEEVSVGSGKEWSEGSARCFFFFFFLNDVSLQREV